MINKYNTFYSQTLSTWTRMSNFKKHQTTFVPSCMFFSCCDKSHLRNLKFFFLKSSCQERELYRSSYDCSNKPEHRWEYPTQHFDVDKNFKLIHQHFMPCGNGGATSFNFNSKEEVTCKVYFATTCRIIEEQTFPTAEIQQFQNTFLQFLF